jgi:serine/threonine protein kinase
VHRNGKKIAVKVLHDRITLDDKQFINEYNNLTKLQHHNIVRLVGCCQENRKEYVNYEGRLVVAEHIKRVLCFEYLHNGDLDKYISGMMLIICLHCYLE